MYAYFLLLYYPKRRRLNSRSWGIGEICVCVCRDLQLCLDMFGFGVFFGERFGVEIVEMLAVFFGCGGAFHFQAAGFVSKLSSLHGRDLW